MWQSDSENGREEYDKRHISYAADLEYTQQDYLAEQTVIAANINNRKTAGAYAGDSHE
jgi:hypothetical protein